MHQISGSKFSTFCPKPSQPRSHSVQPPWAQSTHVKVSKPTISQCYDQENQHPVRQGRAGLQRNFQSDKAFFESTNKIENLQMERSKRSQYFSCISPSQRGAERDRTQFDGYSCRQILHLIKNQDQCLKNCKQTFDRDTQRLETKFTEFKQIINNTIDDLKLSIVSCLSQRYSSLIKRMKDIKSDYIAYTNEKKQFWNQEQNQSDFQERSTKGGKTFSSHINQKADNKILIAQLMEDMQEYKLHMKYQGFGEAQQKLLKPIIKSSKKLLKGIQIETHLDNHNIDEMLAKLHEEVFLYLRNFYDKMDMFFITEKQQNQKIKQKKRKSTSHTKQSQTAEFEFKNDYELKQIVSSGNKITLTVPSIDKSKLVSSLKKQKVDLIPVTNLTSSVGEKDKQASTSHTDRTGHSHSQEGFGSFNRIQAQRQVFAKIKNNCQTDQHVCRLVYEKAILDRKDTGPQVQTAICLQILPSERIAVGTKCGLIKIFEIRSGSKIAELNRHNASVCSLSLLISPHRQVLISGGDVGCSKIILWDALTLKYITEFSGYHTAAITCLTTLRDNQFVSGSLDKTLRLFNSESEKQLDHIQTQSKITCMLQTKCLSLSQNPILVISHLSALLSLWNVSQTRITILHKISIPGVALCMAIKQHAIFGTQRNPIFATENAVFEYNVEFNKINKIKQISMCQDLLVFEGGVAACLNNGQIVGVKNLNSQIGVGSCLSYACGVSPKTIVTGEQRDILLMVNHKNVKSTEIRMWILQKSSNFNTTY